MEESINRKSADHEMEESADVDRREIKESKSVDLEMEESVDVDRREDVDVDKKVRTKKNVARKNSNRIHKTIGEDVC